MPRLPDLPVTPSEIAATAREGADSVFAYVARTAEAVPGTQDAGGRVRWRTLSYENAYYHDASVFNGTGGIPLFLAEYHRLTGSARALELALGGLRWASTDAPDGPTFIGETGSDGALCFGRAGVGMAWLHLARVLDRPSDGPLDGALDERATLSAPRARPLAAPAAAPVVDEAMTQARRFGNRVLAAPLGPVTDYIGGAAGAGVFLARLWEATRDERYRTAAVRAGEWLAAHATRDAAGCHWPVAVNGRFGGAVSLGFAHGISGIGSFLLLLHQATGESRWADLAREVAGTLSRQAQPDRGGLNWPVVLGRTQTPACQWCHGSPGIGLFYTQAHETLCDAAYLDTARAAGETTFARGDTRGNPSRCHGLAGNAELLVELYRLTGDAVWLERAHAFARLAFGYRRQIPDGDAWQSDEPGLDSPDFMCGAAGTGYFFLRLLAPRRVPQPLL